MANSPYQIWVFIGFPIWVPLPHFFDPRCTD